MAYKFWTGLVLAAALGMISAGRASAEAQAVHQEFEGFNLSGYSDGGSKAWDINGDTADVSDQKIKINNVNANSYGEQDMNVKAKTGMIDKANGNVHLEENVVITSERGTKMTTDTLDWHRNQDLVTTEDPVKITDEGMVVTGKGMTAHPSLKDAALNSDVKAQMQTAATDSAPKQDITITSDGPMTIDQLKQVAIFNDNVFATEASAGRELRADKMEVYFDQASSHIKKMICTGNVSIKQGGNVSYAEKLVYDADSQLMTFSGRPKLVFELNNNKGGKGLFGTDDNEENKSPF